MTINKEKVISVPKEYRDKEDIFLCPCPICAERIHIKKMENLQLDQAKHIIENIFETTALDGKEFQINVGYIDANIETVKIKRSSELRNIRSIVKSTLSLTSQFNKKYRHPLICKLNAHALTIDSDMIQYDTMNHYGDIWENRLWKLVQISQKTNDIGKLIDIIISEDFFDNEKLNFLKSKIVIVNIENKQQLKKLFINALKTSEFEPHCSSTDYNLL